MGGKEEIPLFQQKIDVSYIQNSNLLDFTKYWIEELQIGS